MGLLGILLLEQGGLPPFFFGSGKEDYLDAGPKGLSFSISSTGIILQRTMLTLDFLLLGGFTQNLNK